jgi:hypothetical protein
MKVRSFSFFSFICLLLVSEASLAASINQLDLFGQAMLAQHNAKRAAHNAPAMVWDTQLAAAAQAWADTADEREHPSAHDTNRGFTGENMFIRSGSSASIDQLTQGAVGAWYAEIERFDFSNPNGNTSNQIGHFSQVIWNRSIRLGCGAAVFSNSQLAGFNGMFVVVCRYSEPGNVMGQFAQNVLPPTNPVASVPSFSNQPITASVNTTSSSGLTTSSNADSGLIITSSNSGISTSSSTKTSNTKDFNIASTQMIAPGTTLNKGKKFYSPNKKYFAVFQSDGNLVVFTASGKRISGLESIKGLDYKEILLISLPIDGDLTFLDKNKKPLFKASSVAKIAPKSRLVLSDDGQLLLMNSDEEVIFKL